MSGNAAEKLAQRLRIRFAAAFWNSLASALPRVALLLAGLYVAHRFGPEAFARYSLATVTVMVVGNLMATALTNVGAKFVPGFAAGRIDRLGTGFATLLIIAALLALTLGAAVFAIAPWLAQVFGVDPPVTGLLRVAALAIAAVIVQGGAMALLAGSKRFRQMALVNGAGIIVFAILLLPLNTAWGSAGTLAALAALYGVAGVLGIACIRGAAARDWRESRRADVRHRGRRMLGFLVPILFASGMLAPVVWICNSVLAHGEAPLANVARFNAAYSWFAVVSFLPAILAQVEFVHMSHARAAGEAAGLSRALRLFVAQNLALMVPVTLIGMAFASTLMGLFRVDDAEARLCLRLLLGAALMASIGNPAGLFLAVIDRIWLSSLFNAGWAVVALGIAYLLRDAGAIGVATAFFVAYTAHFFVATYFAWRLTRRHVAA